MIDLLAKGFKIETKLAPHKVSALLFCSAVGCYS